MSAKVALFTLGSRSYALPVAAISHILPLQPIFHLPLLRSDFAGVIVDHGEIVPVMRANRCLGGAAMPGCDAPVLLVVYGAEIGCVALPADKVVQMVDSAQGKMCAAPPECRHDGVREFFLLQEQDYPLLDVDALLASVPS